MLQMPPMLVQYLDDDWHLLLHRLMEPADDDHGARNPLSRVGHLRPKRVSDHGDRLAPARNRPMMTTALSRRLKTPAQLLQRPAGVHCVGSGCRQPLGKESHGRLSCPMALARAVTLSSRFYRSSAGATRKLPWSRAETAGYRAKWARRPRAGPPQPCIRSPRRHPSRPPRRYADRVDCRDRERRRHRRRLNPTAASATAGARRDGYATPARPGRDRRSQK